MPYCTSCGKEVREEDTHCASCGAQLRTVQRPTGISIIAALTIIGAFFGLVGVFMGNPTMVLGIILTDTISRIYSLVASVIGLYCGFGLWNMKKLPFDIFIGWVVFGIVNSLLSILRLEKLLALQGMSFDDGSAAIVISIGFVLGLAFGVFILVYLLKKRSLFTN